MSKIRYTFKEECFCR